MTLSEQLQVVKVRKKSYVLCYAGLKRGYATYDVLAFDGSEIGRSMLYDDAVECCQLHYVNNTPPYGRKDRPKQENPFNTAYERDKEVAVSMFQPYHFELHGAYVEDEEFNLQRFTRGLS